LAWEFSSIVNIFLHNINLLTLQAAITEANSLKRVNKTLVQSRDEFVYRSYIGLGQYDIVINEIADSSNVDFRSLKLLALYLQKRTSHVETMIQLDELQNEAAKTSKGTFYYVLGVMHVYGDSIKDALDATDSYNSVEL
jgi:coatomer protein complex subunit epsilon